VSIIFCKCVDRPKGENKSTTKWRIVRTRHLKNTSNRFMLSRKSETCRVVRQVFSPHEVLAIEPGSFIRCMRGAEQHDVGQTAWEQTPTPEVADRSALQLPRDTKATACAALVARRKTRSPVETLCRTHGLAPESVARKCRLVGVWDTLSLATWFDRTSFQS
jgi:hypothetical protein